MPECSSSRYAIYYTPAPEHPLTVAARAWLGRDAFVPGSFIEGGSRAYLISEPRRYGFHATLKAPFRLRDNASVEELERALGKFVAEWPPCPIGPLKIDLLGGFFALVPASPIPTLRSFASHIVEEFDRFRAPMNELELRRRLRNSLDDAETTNLVSWGYPYVFDRFRFHMTLTDRVPPESRPILRKELDAIFQALLAEDYKVDTLSLFVQEHPCADFAVRSQFVLRSRTFLRDAV